MINALKWLVNFLETRFPEKVTPVSQAKFDLALGYIADTANGHKSCLDKLSVDVEKLQKQIETLNLRVGLSRPIPYGLKDKQHG